MDVLLADQGIQSSVSVVAQPRRSWRLFPDMAAVAKSMTVAVEEEEPGASSELPDPSTKKSEQRGRIRKQPVRLGVAVAEIEQPVVLVDVPAHDAGIHHEARLISLHVQHPSEVQRP